MQTAWRALAGGAHEPAEGLVHLLHAGDLVNAVEGRGAAEAAVFGHAGVLHRVHLGQRRADRAAAAWAIATTGWAWRYGGWLGRPRADGRPG